MNVIQLKLDGDDYEAIRALVINPLVADYHTAKAYYEEMKEAHRNIFLNSLRSNRREKYIFSVDGGNTKQIIFF